MDGHLISVIIPVYKVEGYLDKCVQSVINQTYSNLEIILVDDGSPDRCGQMCDDYAKLDSRIKVIHKVNGGLSDARNVALNCFTGDYVCFVDSDDVVSPYYVQHMYQLVDIDTEIVVCVPRRFVNDSEIESLTSKRIKNKKYPTTQALYDLLRQNGLQFEPSAWGKLYSARVFSDLRFPVGKYYEDLATTYLAIDKVANVVHTSEELYYYRQREDSQSESIFNERYLDILGISDEMHDYLLPRYPELEKMINSRVISAYCHILIRLPDDAKWNVLKKTIYGKVVELRKGLLLAPIRNKNKAIVLLSYLGEKYFLTLVKLVMRHKAV